MALLTKFSDPFGDVVISKLHSLFYHILLTNIKYFELNLFILARIIFVARTHNTYLIILTDCFIPLIYRYLCHPTDNSVLFFERDNYPYILVDTYK